MDVIKAATSVPAAALGMNDLGTLAVGKMADFLAMPNNPLEKMSNIKDIGMLYFNGSEQERSALIQNIQDQLRRPEDHEQRQRGGRRCSSASGEGGGRRQAAALRRKFPLGKSPTLRGVPIPAPKYSKVDVKVRRTASSVSIRASAADFRGFYSKLLPVNTAGKNAGNCWEKDSPSRSLCLEASNNQAISQSPRSRRGP